MSYYTYFTLKSYSKYKDTTINDCKEKSQRNLRNEDKEKSIFLAQMVNAYYDERPEDKYSKIYWYLSSYVYNHKIYDENDILKELLSNDNKVICRNHCQSEYDMESEEEGYDEAVNRILNRLLIRATIRFVPDERYSDVPKTIMEYLSTDYIKEIEEELDYLEELTKDYVFAKFVLENCDRFSEDEWYKMHSGEEEK